MEFHYPVIDMGASGRHLKALCTAAGYTPQQLCRLLKMSAPQSVYHWYRGRTLPSNDNLFALSRLLETHMEELLVERISEEE